MRRYVVGVMGPGEGADPEDIANARALGRLIAEVGWAVLSGGRNIGVMKAVNEGAKEVPGSLTISILPTADAKPNPNVDVVILTDMGNARNNINVLSSDVVVACGSGGAGTASEIALALKAGKTVILLGAGEEAERFFRKLGKKRVIVVQTPAEAVMSVRRLQFG